MFLCLLLLATLPQSESKLTISNIRQTLVDCGPTRSDNTYLPGDKVHVTFDAAGYKLDEEGRYQFSAKLVVEDAAGKLVGTRDFGQSPTMLGAIGNGKTRHAFHLDIPFDQAAGTYKIKFIMGDVLGKSSATGEQVYKVQPPTFGLVRLQIGRPPTAIVGEILQVSVHAVNIGKQKENQGTVEMTMEVKDATGKTLGKPQVSTFADVSTNEPLLIRLDLPLDQAGKYQLHLRAVDKASTNKASLIVPITVVE